MTEEIVITIEAFGVGELSAPEEVVKALELGTVSSISTRFSHGTEMGRKGCKQSRN